MMILNPYRYAAAGGGTTDPHWASVVSLLRFPGADGSTTFTDEKGKTWTAAGNAQIDTSTGQQAGQFDGVGDYIESPDSADWAFGTGAFTVEAVVRFNSAASNSTVLSQWSGTASNAAWALFIMSGRLYLRFSESTVSVRDTSAVWAPTPGVNHHIAADRDAAGTVRIYVDGVVKASASHPQTMLNSSRGLRLGVVEGYAGTFDLSGYVLQARVTKGVARYAGAFTPPSLPYPNS